MELKVGSVFGRLTVIHQSVIAGRGHSYCKCTCGHEKWIRNDRLTTAKYPIRSCGCILSDKKRDFMGRVFGRLTVIAAKGKVNKNGYSWLCRCECGNEKVISTSNLTSNKTRSCGCYAMEERYKAIGDKARHRIVKNKPLASFKRQLKSAIYVGREWKLTFDEYVEIISQNCHYCGSPPTFYISEGFYRNGIDRVDSLITYEKQNCVACCITCNRMKGKISKTEFISQCHKVSLFMSAIQPFE
jgi:hypothetical protein